MTTQIQEKVFKYECSQEEWKEFIEVFDSGEVIEINEEMFYYWLEVLPPVYMNEKKEIVIDGYKRIYNMSFGFAEGMEYVKDFWQDGTRFFCVKSNRMNKPW